MSFAFVIGGAVVTLLAIYLVGAIFRTILGLGALFRGSPLKTLGELLAVATVITWITAIFVKEFTTALEIGGGAAVIFILWMSYLVGDD
ncbi:hypothetical protein ACT1U9_10855 [Streptomyces sp. BR1]|uniref:hypothetical protein n=1 Tax=Streptomyces sp. BR1 TaxID=1592323 RepID=UPI00402BE200